MKTKNKENIYRWMHEFVRQEKGEAWQCIVCGLCGTGQTVNWANIYHTVTFFVSDYIQLCGECHFKFVKY